jgi:hypothetical protein
MFTLFEPSDKKIKDFLAQQRELPLSYEEVGASKNEIPSGYPINHHRVQIGKGADDFAAAKKAIHRWAMYELEWTRLYPVDAPIEIGEVVCVIVNHGFCWSLNPCRIVYVLEETGLSSDSDLLSEHCPDTVKKAKNDLPSNGAATIRFGSSFYLSPARITF